MAAGAPSSNSPTRHTLLPSAITPASSNSSSAARKLPIKRRTPVTPTPTPDPLPTPALDSIPYEYDDYEDGDDDLDDPDATFASAAAAGVAADPRNPAPPFKFQRIWSEADEIRFLQGLLGCFNQGLVFPRDLNVFFDRFSESMPQPYTRSQLSEKLRRLRRKYRVTSARVDSGLDPSRLAPHDRDLLHLCARLWHPDHAAASPFSTPDAAGGSNKRRRRNPATTASSSSTPVVRPTTPALSQPPLLLLPAAPVVENNENHLGFEISDHLVAEDLPVNVPIAVKEEKPADNGYNKGNMGPGRLAANAIMDVFDGCLKEVRSQLLGGEADLKSADELANRWKQQRIAELDVLGHRLRMVLEQANASFK